MIVYKRTAESDVPVWQLNQLEYEALIRIRDGCRRSPDDVNAVDYHLIWEHDITSWHLTSLGEAAIAVYEANRLATRSANTMLTLQEKIETNDAVWQKRVNELEAAIEPFAQGGADNPYASEECRVAARVMGYLDDEETKPC